MSQALVPITPVAACGFGAAGLRARGPISSLN